MLTDDEKKELDGYLEEEEQEAKARAEAGERQHLEAMRLRRKYAREKAWKHGEDFVVLEANRENLNIVVRCPTEEEATIVEGKDVSAEDWEKFVATVTVHPARDVLIPLKVKYPGIGNAIIQAATLLVGGAKVASAKK